jgi:hypothetical protein
LNSPTPFNPRRGPVLRRRAEAPVVEDPVVEPAAEPGPEAVAAAPAGLTVSEMAQASPRTQTLDVGTPIRMIGGVHLGRSGVVTCVQNRATSFAVDAVYTLVLDEVDGVSERVCVKQSSLGRLWVRTAEAAA